MCEAAAKRVIAGIGKVVYLTNAIHSLTSSLRPRRSSPKGMPMGSLCLRKAAAPAVKREHDYMLSYSPYDNVIRKNYPAMYVSAAFYDSQVSYAEPAKWVARLRASKTDLRDLLLRTDMDSGHQGRSGRGGSTSQNAEIIGWLIAHAQEPILQ